MNVAVSFSINQILLFLEQYDKIIIDASPVKSFFKAINVV